MTDAELLTVRTNLFRKAKELGAVREEAEDLAQEAFACFLRWKDGGEGSQLGHAITHARGSLHGWVGTGKSAKAKRDDGAIHAEDLPPEEWGTVLNRAINPEPGLIAAIDFLAALEKSDAGLMWIYLDAEFSNLTRAEVCRRHGLTLSQLEKRIGLFRRYLERIL